MLLRVMGPIKRVIIIKNLYYEYESFLFNGFCYK